MSPRTKRSTALTTSAADCAGAVPPARRAALRMARFERRTMPDIWIDPPNSGFRFGGSFCMRKQCACIRGGIGGGAVGRSVCARCLCVPVGLVHSFAMSGRGAGLRGDAVLLLRFVSVYACCLCVPVGIVCSFAMSGRGAGLRGDAVSVAAYGLRFTLGDAVLLSRFVLRSRLSFFLCQEKRDGLRYLAFLFRRVEIAIRAFSRCWRGYRLRLVHFGLVRFFMAISTGYRGRGATRERGWRRGLCTSLRCHISLAMLSAGSTLGLRAPNLRQRVFDSLDSLHAAAGLGWYEYAAFVRLCAGTLALQCFPPGERWGCAPQTAPKSHWLSGLSSGAGRVRKCVSRGGAVLVRIRAAVARVHGKTRPALIYGRAGRAVLR